MRGNKSRKLYGWHMLEMTEAMTEYLWVHHAILYESLQGWIFYYKRLTKPSNKLKMKVPKWTVGPTHMSCSFLVNYKLLQVFQTSHIFLSHHSLLKTLSLSWHYLMEPRYPTHNSKSACVCPSMTLLPSVVTKQTPLHLPCLKAAPILWTPFRLFDHHESKPFFCYW